MKKILLISVAAVFLLAGEFEYGSGTYKLSGGFIGLNNEKSTNIDTYSLKENHKSIFLSYWYYGYEFTWYDSDALINTQQTLSNLTPVTIPAITYKYQGLDANIILGRDISKSDENQYIGCGILLGVSIPYIDTGKSSSNSDSTSDILMNAMKTSKTKIKTFKIGPVFQGAYKIGTLFSLYGKGIYAYQSGNIKNDYANVNTQINGNFEEFEFGIKFQPFDKDYKLGLFTFKTRLYMTFGYRYTRIGN